MLRPCQHSHSFPSCLHNRLPFALVHKHSDRRISQYPFLVDSPSHDHPPVSPLRTRFGSFSRHPQVCHLTMADDGPFVARKLGVVRLGRMAVVWRRGLPASLARRIQKC